MFTTREAPLPAAPSFRTRLSFAVRVLVVSIASIAVLVAIVPTLRTDSREHARVYPATLTSHVRVFTDITGSGEETYSQPAEAVVLSGQMFVLDTGNSRILVQDQAGAVQHVINPSAESGPALDAPMALATDGTLLYVANTGASTILAMQPDGVIVRTVDLTQAPAARHVPRPVGLAVDAEGGLLVSDAAGNRVLRYGADGQFRQVIGSSTRAGGSQGFNSPGGLAVDAGGYIYVVDILNGRVVKLTPDGIFAGETGRLGNTGGTFFRPKDVAVDGDGNVYVSDGLLAAVQVFDRDGHYLGFIGRADPADPGSRSLFMAPAGLAISGDTLYVVDRFQGLFSFQLR